MLLTDPRIESYQTITWSCPEAHEGKLKTGEYFYFRFRSGVASLCLDWTAPPTGPATCDAYNAAKVGDNAMGIFDDDHQRNGVFRKLLDEMDEGAGFDGDTYGI